MQIYIYSAVYVVSAGRQVSAGVTNPQPHHEPFLSLSNPVSTLLSNVTIYFILQESRVYNLKHNTNFQ